MRMESLAATPNPAPRQELRGRRPTFKVPERVRLAELIREHGIRGTQRVAGGSVSTKTLIKIGREFGIQLPRGRGQRRAA